MSTNNITLKMLGIEDPNIKLTNDFSKIDKKGVKYNQIHGTLSYEPDFCPICGCTNENHSIIKHGSKCSNIKLLPINGIPTYLSLKKQRFLCKNCHHTFIAHTDIVRKFCFLSNSIKCKLLSDLNLKRSEKDIAFDNYVSHSTVSKAVDSCFSSFAPNLDYLPKHLMFDEFKSTRDAKGAMSFIFADAEKHEVIDILESRTKRDLTAYFRNFSKVARCNVETISMDMYSPYIDIAKVLFPNAKIILDKFHLVQLISRAFNITRVQTMKNFPTSSLEYKRLKRYWKIFLKPLEDLNSIDFRHYYHFKTWVSQKDIVKVSVTCDHTLKATYDAFQILYQDIRNDDYEALSAHLALLKNANTSTHMRTAVTSLEANLPYIQNTFEYEYSNGILEGINNYIKVLKRIAFGYKSFFHFRNRILISRKLISPKGEF